MNSGKTIFAQLMEFVPAYEFRKCVDRYNGNFKMKSFSCWDQYLCMAFAQLTYRESLRDIEACLRATQSKLYHLGIRGKVSRNTLAHANQTRDWRIYADFAQILITRARKLYTEESFGIELDQAVYALDSTTIDLCLALFPWAEFRKRKGAIKLHTLLDLRGNIPSVVIITTGKVHDVNILDNLIIEAGAIYVMDRGYLDFARLYKIHQNLAFFVTRTKRNFSRKRLYSNPVDKSQGVQFDQIVTLKGYYAKKDYPEKLRRIGYLDSKNNQSLVFLTNNFVLPAKTIADLYRCRWQVELFFKWIKQHLMIKAFYGTTENAVKTQVWIAISVYVLVAIVKKSLNLDQSLYTILQVLSVTLFEKKPILQALSNATYTNHDIQVSNQLNLFN
ncbi:IS4 transposase [Syntrophus gentianae]|uniref:IS4 transposase n=1 Tax=Syntrophus gentianae TaxID=43775 RepID=A0A1H8BHI8_9BACT|nr:IS4 family transposase [Syntrophus gentianae]SEL98540.1 IS4 transposase [Syntrophus gentianae]SEM69998.1 IS4 transposase [Syntrophus gentianae]SEM81448.1 IS4 transposase [Syntrophus gentianae]